MSFPTYMIPIIILGSIYLFRTAKDLLKEKKSGKNN